VPPAPLATFVLSRTVAGVGAHAPVSPPTTARSPFVTLLPPGRTVARPSDANDGSDFYGLGAAVIGIALIVVIAKLAFRGRGRVQHEER
jgi:hypothetical protein